MSAPSDLPPAEHWPHGVRARYSSGCRCDACRAANTAYERQRARHRVYHGPDVLVSARRARRHLRALSRRGVGRRAVGAACDVGETTLERIKNGTKTQIRRSTEAKILSVDAQAMADSVPVDAGPTWKLLNELIDKGWPKAELARRLGYKVPALQVGKKQVLLKTAHKVKLLHTQLIELAPPRPRRWCHCRKPLPIPRDDGKLCAKCERMVKPEQE